MQFTNAEKDVRLREIDQQMASAEPVRTVRAQDCIRLLKDLSHVWSAATNEERTRLIAPLVERAYIDVETKRIEGLIPAEGFGWLLQEVLEQQGRSACMLLPAEAADQPEWWTWWRRGRLNLH